MLKTRLLHPEILSALGQAGHGSRVLIADGNFPLATHSNPNARHVYLNLSAGLVSVTDVVDALVDTIPIEAASVMQPDAGDEPSIFREFRTALPGLTLEPLARFDFYAAAGRGDVALAILTGEVRIYANILLTIGVRMPER